MIRPVTCLCVLLAAGSGLYLYQVKHRTLMLDARIAAVLKQAEEARARTAVLKTDYAVLNQTDRLTDLSTRYLELHPLAPNQFVQLAALDRHLPPIEQFPRPGETRLPEQGATDADADYDVIAALPPAIVDPPAAPKPARAFAQNPIHRVAAAPTRLAAADRPQPMPMAAPRPVASSVLATAYRPGIGAARAPAYAAAGASYAGSALGGASSPMLAAPVPVQN